MDFENGDSFDVNWIRVVSSLTGVYRLCEAKLEIETEIEILTLSVWSFGDLICASVYGVDSGPLIVIENDVAAFVNYFGDTWPVFCQVIHRRHRYQVYSVEVGTMRAYFYA